MSKNYSTTVSLNTNDNDRWQFVFASQAYGTFYGIYALFMNRELYHEDGTIDRTKVGVEEIQLELINYKGTLDLSLIAFDITPPEYDTSNSKPMIIEVKIQANIANDVRTEELKPVNFSVNHNTRLEVNRLLLSINGLTKKELDNKITHLESLLDNDQITRSQFNEAITQLAFYRGVFDEEYFFRNGKLPPKLRKDGDFAYSADEIRNAKLGSQTEANGHLGYWCIGTRSKLVTY